MTDNIVSFDWVDRLPRLSKLAESDLWLYISTICTMTQDYDIVEKVMKQ